MQLFWLCEKHEQGVKDTEAHTWLITLSKFAGTIGVELFDERIIFARPLAENDPGT